MKVKIEQLNKDLPLPKYMTKQAAGMDLYANTINSIVINPNEIRLVPTGIKISLPNGYEAQIRPRSGLALKNGISVVNSPGTIDADYRGEIKVIMINHGSVPFMIEQGDRIAQMVINKVEQIEWETVTELEESERGEGGFGHTGK